MELRSVLVISKIASFTNFTEFIAVSKIAPNAVLSIPLNPLSLLFAFVFTTAKSVGFFRSNTSFERTLLSKLAERASNPLLAAASSSAPVPEAAAAIALTVVISWEATFSVAKASSASTPAS